MIGFMEAYSFLVAAAIDAVCACFYYAKVLGRGKRRPGAFGRTALAAALVFGADAALAALVPGSGVGVSILKNLAFAAVLAGVGRAFFTRRPAPLVFITLSFLAIRAICTRLAGALGGLVMRWVVVLVGPDSTRHPVFAAAYVIQLVFFAGVFFFSLWLIGRSFRGGGEAITPGDVLPLSLPCLLSLILYYALQPLLYYSSEGAVLVLQELPWLDTLFTVTSFALLLTLLSSVVLYQRQLRLQAEERRRSQLQHQVALLKERTEQLQSSFESMDLLRHDIKYHMANIGALAGTLAAENPGPAAEALAGYVGRLDESVRGTEQRFNTGDAVTDVILQGAGVRAEALGADFEAAFVFPARLGLDPYDMAVVLDNALDNALEAVAGVDPPGRRRIRLECRSRGQLFFITAENSFEGGLRPGPAGGLPTTKPGEGHGRGLASMRSVAEKYDGVMEWSTREDEGAHLFTLTVMMKGPLAGGGILEREEEKGS